MSVAWSADGRLASGSVDNTVIVWDLERGLPAHTLEGNADWVSSVAWSVDRRLASGSLDGTVVVWDLERGLPAQTLEGHAGTVWSVARSADGWLASGDDDRNVQVWQMNPEEWIRQACHRAGRNFTQAEWRLCFPDEEYRKTCEHWPAGQ
jgi:WD40 repeat protein